MPLFSILFFIFTLCKSPQSGGIPLSLNFLGEFMSLAGIFQRNPIVGIIGATGIVFSACYSIYQYNRISYGVFSPHLKPIKDVNRREFNFIFLTKKINRFQGTCHPFNKSFNYFKSFKD